MTNEDNAYQTLEPGSTELVASNVVKSSLYSPRQGGLAAFLGGPLAGIYVLNKNFETVGNTKYAANVKILGIFFMLVLVGIAPFLPAKFPGTSMGVVWVVITVRMMSMYLPTKEQIAESNEYQFRSNWSVLGVSVVSLIVTFALIVVWAVVATTMGLVHIS